jgi:hypothetical protein
MKWQYEAVAPDQPPVVLLLHYRTREELMQIMAPEAGQASHAQAMMRAAAAAAARADPSRAPAAAAPPCAGGDSVVRNGFSDEFDADHVANYSHLPLDDDDIKVGMRRTFSNSSCGSFLSDPVFKSEALSGEDLPYERRRSSFIDSDDTPSALNPASCTSKPSPPLLPSQSSPQLAPLRSPPQFTSPGTFLSVPTP